MAEPLPQTRDLASPSPLQSSPFYGWRMVGVAFFVDFIAVGFFFYSYGVFFKALAAEFGGSRFGVGAGLMLSNVVGALVAPFLGRALDGMSIRRLMLAGTASVSIGFLLLSQIQSQWHFFLVLGSFIALGMASMGGMSTAKLVANWFERRRGTALGVATMGISLSGMLMPPIAVLLIAKLGWRGGFATYGVLTALLVLPVVARFVVDRPEELGLLPDGERVPEAHEAPTRSEDPAWRTREIFRSANFWAIALAFALVFACLSALLTHLVPFVTDSGIPAERAALLLSVSAGCGVLGKVIFGWIADRGDPRFAVWLCFAGQLAGLLLLMRVEGFASLALACGIFGLGMGGSVPLQAALVGRAFGRASFGKAMGLLRPAMIPLHGVGVPFAGWVYDRTGSYDLAFQVFVGLYLLAFLTMFAFKLPTPGQSLEASRPPVGEPARPA